MNINKKMNLHQWAIDFKNQKERGLSLCAWARINNIPENTLRYRFKQVQLAMEKQLEEKQINASIVQNTSATVVCSDEEPVFAKVNLTAPAHISSGINIKFKETAIDIAPDVPYEHVRMVLEALVYAK